MKFIYGILIIFLYFIFSNTYATVCFFDGYKIENNNVYTVTVCDNKYENILPFADAETFSMDQENNSIASDANYNYLENYVTSLSNDSTFIELAENIYTDRKNIFIKTKDQYLYLSKYRFDTKIFRIYHSDNGGRVLLFVDGKLYNIDFIYGYVSYDSSIYKITNIYNLENFKQITDYVFTDGNFFYSTTLKNKGSVGMNFGFDTINAELFSSKNKQFAHIQQVGDRITQVQYNNESLKKIEDMYNKLSLTKNPYTGNDETVLYNEFFIKKELILHYLSIILNK